ncbi:helix-turn-helix domain-containing protein [Chryseobacterium sp. MEBOG07]|uniref:helix-turn-helix domain-containing protein n=1 Tax=Chryseobacterium sp. MEBOG07 TaxID=2879939 RepID=UPI001F2F9BBA|nr:helix-turn-helix domain-containing protein [Chryseobacterium sp. MEBOG07]UKB78324.1 helix-turn-helix domain-containing protein [Chryseobacterium sp. MEBOG07]
MISNLEATLLVEDLRYCDAILITQKTKESDEKELLKNDILENKIYLAVDYLNLTYYYLKCGMPTNAQLCLTKYEDLLAQAPDNEKHNFRLSFYYLTKAMILADGGKKAEAKLWFTKAHNEAVKSDLKLYISRITEEEINYDILDPLSQKKYFTEYVKQKQILKSHAEKVIAQEQFKQDNELKKTRFFLIIILFASLLAIFFIFLYNHKRKKIIKLRFEKIIENIKNESLSHRPIEFKNDATPRITIEEEEEEGLQHIEETKENVIMSEDREKDLLDKINRFESGALFTEKNFTMGQMSYTLESNSKYINYVLQKYRGKTFSDYVNELRIKFIIDKLIKNPEYLSYKINYLAEISGFSSNSRFAYIFKKELGISPSEFISQLSKKNKN